jgi:hypothetical protein
VREELFEKEKIKMGWPTAMKKNADKINPVKPLKRVQLEIHQNFI